MLTSAFSDACWRYPWFVQWGECCACCALCAHILVWARRHGPVPAGRVCCGLPMGDGLLGRVVDAQGLAFGPWWGLCKMWWLSRWTAVRSMPWTVIQCVSRWTQGVRAINALLTVGRGQRLGLFAGSGVGKSVLVGHDGPLHTVPMSSWWGLIGERGPRGQGVRRRYFGGGGPCADRW